MFELYAIKEGYNSQVNTAIIVIVAGMGMVKQGNPSLLQCNGGYVRQRRAGPNNLCKLIIVEYKSSELKCPDK